MSFDENMITELTEANKKLSIENFNLQSMVNEYEQKMNDSYSKEKATLLFKIQKVKQKLHNMHLKKSGKNNFSHYEYYELEDINKPICDALLEEGLASLFTFEEKKGYLRIIDSETGAWTCWNTELDTSIRYKESLKNTGKKGNVGEVMQSNQALQTYARRTLYLQALEIAEPNVIEHDGTEKKDANNVGKDTISIPENLSPAVNDIFNRIKKDFGNKVELNKKTITNKLNSMKKNGTITDELYTECIGVLK